MIIVFDFDGTLADSLSVLLDVYNTDIAAKWHTKPVDAAYWLELRQTSFTKGLKEVGVKPYHLARMLTEGRRIVKSRAHDIVLFKGAVELVKQLANDGHELYALSTNDQHLVREVLDAAGLGDEIHVLKSPLLFGKANSLRRLLKQTGAAPDTVWMIGDELRDLSAARRVGIRSMAVTWGFQPEVTLAAAKPDVLAHNFKEIKKHFA